MPTIETQAREMAMSIIRTQILDNRFGTVSTSLNDDWDLEVHVYSSTKYEAFLYAVEDHPFRKGERFTNTEKETKVV